MPPDLGAFAPSVTFEEQPFLRRLRLRLAFSGPSSGRHTHHRDLGAMADRHQGRHDPATWMGTTR